MAELIRCERCGRAVSSDAVRRVAGLLVCPACAEIGKRVARAHRVGVWAAVTSAFRGFWGWLTRTPEPIARPVPVAKPAAAEPVKAAAPLALAAQPALPWGPPNSCRYCGSALRTVTRAESQNTGCLFVVLGLLISWACVGIPVLLYGLSLMCERTYYWSCVHCGASFRQGI